MIVSLLNFFASFIATENAWLGSKLGFKFSENSGNDDLKFEHQGARAQASINAGLLCYPVLMAADILLYDANIVPVGKDQLQHVEMTRDIAGSFNHLMGETLILPESQVSEDVMIIPGVDGRKMSKSYDNTINLFAEEIFVFSPKGDLITLPTGATSLDFAFKLVRSISKDKFLLLTYF